MGCRTNGEEQHMLVNPFKEETTIVVDHTWHLLYARLS